MKKQFKIVMLLFSFICALNFTGCITPMIEQSGGHFYNLGSSPSYITYNGRWTTEESVPLVSDSGLVIISNKAQFDEVFGALIDSKEQDWINDDFINTTISFNEEFFETKQLVSFVFAANSGRYTYKLLKTNLKNDTLTITLVQEGPQVLTFDVKFWLAIIEIEKVPTDTTVNIVYKNN